ncbi:hypothetical protein Tco_0978781 [Tanacetum coccineum]|uniref:Uncharacterized protein n=1 Tax=Tanacetum coccineum TaxID=301880 RepID=A0ABQ5ENU3_9ASTR
MLEFWQQRRGRTVTAADSKALVTIDGEGVDCPHHSEDEDLCFACFATAQTQTTDVWSDALIIEEYESDSDDEKGPTWLFDLDYLTDSMNYHPVSSENQANLHAVNKKLTKMQRQEKEANEEAEVLRKKFEHLVIKEGAAKPSSTNIFSTVSTPAKASSTNPLNTVSIPVPKGKPNWVFGILECLHLTWNPTQNRNYAEHILTGNPQQSFSIFWQRLSFLWQCKSRPLCPTLPQKAEYVAVASRCGQVFVDSDSKWHIDDSEVSVLGCYYWDDKSISCIGLIEFRGSLRRVTDGTEALLIPTLFILWLDKVSTASAKFVPLGKVCTAIKTLKKNTAKALISLLTTISLSSTMAVLDSCPKHNMVAYLEKSEGNAEFHEIIDFLKRSSIHHALTVSPVVSTTFVEQFWTSAKSKTINNVRHITAKVAGKSVSISEASIRSDLLFNDADGIDTLPNQAIFDAIQQMGSKSTSWDQIPTNIATAVICLTSNQKYNFSKLIFDGKQLANVSVPLDHFPVNTLTSKVFSFMVKKGKHFSGKVTPLFATMLVQPTQDEGASSERPSEALPTPSPAPTSEVPNEPQTDSSPAQTSEVPFEHQPNQSPRPSPTPTIPDSIPVTSGENLGGHSSSDKSLSGIEGDMTLQSVYDLCLSLCAQVSDQAKEIKDLKAQITKLKKQAKPVIKHHKAYLKSVSLKQRFPRKSFSKKHRVHKESVSKQGRKFAKGESSVQRDPMFDEIPEDTADHMDTGECQDEGRQGNSG